MPSRWKPGTEPTTRSGGRPIDPCFEWADHTGWRGFAQHAGWTRSEVNDDAEVQITVRVVEGEVASIIHLEWLRVAQCYGDPIQGTASRARHFTAFIARKNLHRLRAGHLPADWELSMPLRDADRVSRGSAIGRFGPSRAQIDFQALNQLWNGIAQAKARDALWKVESREGGVIAVIDFGCPFLNPSFFTDRPGNGRLVRTRLRSLWDQGSEASPPLLTDKSRVGWPWVQPSAVGYGRELGPAVLNTLAKATHHTVPPLEETAGYRGVDYLLDYDDARRRVWHATHGAHVLDVAGGLVDPLTGQPDSASRAELVFVQLPAMTAADSAGGSLAGHVLDGVRYVLGRVHHTEDLVINISYGNRAGPHDGSGFIETALDELLQARSHDYAIVLAAGNSRQQASHARRRVRPQRSALFRLWLTPGDSTDTFIEVWYDPPPAGWALQARARSPERLWCPPVQPGQQALMVDDAGKNEVVAMLWHEQVKRHRTADPAAASSVSASQPPSAPPFAFETYDKGLVLLTAAPTAQPPDVPGALAPAGVWEIEVELVRTSGTAADPGPAIDIDAWIERDDPGQAADAGESHFLDQDSDDDQDTLSSLANGRFTIVAGGFRRSDGVEADYSSVGPRRRTGPLPQVLAVCEEDEVQPNIQAAAVRNGEVHRMNGTSVAAPVLARRLYNWLAARRDKKTKPTLQDWEAVLEQLAHRRGDVRPLPED